MNPFSLFRQSRPDASWHRIGLVSDFPEVSEDNEACQVTTACKAFKVPHTKDEAPTETDIELPGELKDQVLIFKYKGAIHAIDHVRPESFDRGVRRLTNAAMSALGVSAVAGESL